MSTDLARRAAAGDFSPEVAHWITEALRRHMEAGEPLEAALGLDRASRLRQRNESLRQAAAQLATGATSAWDLALRLAGAVARYKGRVRPLLEAGHQVQMTPVDEAIHAAFATGCPVPATARNLYHYI